MKSFIAKIFSGESDNWVHQQFQKFGRGNYTYRALVNAKNSKGNYSVATGAEYVNEVVYSLAEKLGANKAKVTGVIVSTFKLSEMPLFHKLLSGVDIKQFAGVKQYVINHELSGTEMMSYLNGFPDAFFALSFSHGGTELKIKAKAPKSAKPSTSEKAPVAEFCKIKTSDAEFVKKILFDVHEFKKAEISHTYLIDEIILAKNTKTPEEMRKLAKRKGKIVRKVIVDGAEKVSEKGFEA